MFHTPRTHRPPQRSLTQPVKPASQASPPSQRPKQASHPQTSTWIGAASAPAAGWRADRSVLFCSAVLPAGAAHDLAVGPPQNLGRAPAGPSECQCLRRGHTLARSRERTSLSWRDIYMRWSAGGAVSPPGARAARTLNFEQDRVCFGSSFARDRANNHRSSVRRRR